MANPYERRSNMRNSSSGGNKTRTYSSGPSYSSTRNTKQDIYGSLGSGRGNHSHKVKANGFTIYSRPGPRGSSSMSLGDILFGPAPKKRR